MVWTISLVAVLLLPPYGSSENKGAIPSTHQLGQLGMETVLRCDTSFPYVEWKFNGGEIRNSEDVYSNGSRYLTLPEAKKPQSGIYSCHPPHSNTTLSRTELQLGLPPEKLHIQCWSSSYPEKINCTWELQPDTNLHAAFLTTYRLGLIGRETPQKCIQLERNPNSCLISNFQMFEEFPYVLNVTARNQLGSKTQLYPFFVENIIRPDPPVNVRVSPMCHESKKLHIQWQPPHSWPYPDIFSLKYKVRYRRAASTAFKMVGPYEQTSLVLTGIRPGSIVYVQVAAKDVTDLGHNSDWSEVVTGRPWQPYDSICLPLLLNKILH